MLDVRDVDSTHGEERLDLRDVRDRQELGMSSRTAQRLGRRIVVDGSIFHWRVTPPPCPEDGDIDFGVAIRARNGRTFSAMQREVSGNSTAITPTMVAEYIRRVVQKKEATHVGT